MTRVYEIVDTKDWYFSMRRKCNGEIGIILNTISCNRIVAISTNVHSDESISIKSLEKI